MSIKPTSTRFFPLVCVLILFSSPMYSQNNPRMVPVDSGWANNSVNVTVFRKNSLVTFGSTQFTAFYDASKHIVLAKRTIGQSGWTIKQTAYTGNTDDAHNIISIMVDGDGYLHVAWDHHNTPLRYCKSREPLSLDLSSELSMTGSLEKQVSYPEFYKLKDGNLLFMYRNGESGKGNLVINAYDLKLKKWAMIQDNLISGEGHRNAYWQACVDGRGTIHISWVWRESPDVASNHDLCYVRSLDGGKTWERSDGSKYTMPVTAENAEYVVRIPQRSELINQTSMIAEGGVPFIASYWRDEGSAIPQYHIVYQDRKRWVVRTLGFRETPFTLSGGGTKRIPISRPQILVARKKERTQLLLIYRDAERNNKVSAVMMNDLSQGKWTLQDLTQAAVGSWEPTFDTELWKNKRTLNLFVQEVEQIDGEGKAQWPSKMIYVLEWKPFR